MSITLAEIKYFAVNLADLTRLNSIELLLVKDKIDSLPPIDTNKNQLDGSAVILRSTLENDYSHDFRERQLRQLYCTCILLEEKCRVRTYYSKNGKSFFRLKIPKTQIATKEV